MKISQGKKDQIHADRKAAKPNLEVEINDDGTPFFFENVAHQEKVGARREKRKENREVANKAKRDKRGKK